MKQNGNNYQTHKRTQRSTTEITKALETILHTCDSEKIKQCNIEMDEAFATLKRLADERKLVEVVKA